MMIIKGKCPCCGKNTEFTTDVSLVKEGFHVFKNWIFASKKQIVKDAIGIAAAATAKNMQCLSCDSLVHQCPKCDHIMKFFNSGNCTNCGQWIA